MIKDSYISPARVVEPHSNYFSSAQRAAKKTLLVVRNPKPRLITSPEYLILRDVVEVLLLKLKRFSKHFLRIRKFRRTRFLKWSTLKSPLVLPGSKKKRQFFKLFKRFMLVRLRNTLHLSKFLRNTRILQLLLTLQLKKVECRLLRRFKSLNALSLVKIVRFNPRRRYKLRKKLTNIKSLKRLCVWGETKVYRSHSFIGNRVAIILNRNLLHLSRIKLCSPSSEHTQLGCPYQRVGVKVTQNKELLSNVFFYNESLLTPLLFKHAIVGNRLANGVATLPSNKVTPAFVQMILRDYTKFFFGARFNQVFKSNVVGLSTYPSIIRRRLIKVFRSRKFDTKVMLWNYNLLGRFMEHCTWHKVYLKLNPLVDKSLRSYDQALARMWYSRVAIFQRMLGPRIFLHESIKIILIALKYKDPMFLCNWIRAMLYRMSFYKYRLLFRYLKYVVGNLLEPSFPDLGLRGFKLRLKGKICVAGNARTRKLLFKVGSTSHSKKSNKVIHHNTLINSFTGVMGFNL